MSKMSEQLPASSGTAGPGYEVRDTNVRAIVIFGVGLFVMLIIVQVSLWVLLKLFSGENPVAASPQIAPDVIHEQRVQLQDHEKAALDGGYGWSNKAKGEIKIPIKDAMKLVAERGLPPTGTKPRTEVDMNSHAGNKVEPAPPEGKANP